MVVEEKQETNSGRLKRLTLTSKSTLESPETMATSFTYRTCSAVAVALRACSLKTRLDLDGCRLVNVCLKHEAAAAIECVAAIIRSPIANGRVD